MRDHRSLVRLFAACALTLLHGAVGRSEAQTIAASHDDAYIAHEPASTRWSIGTRELQLDIGFDQSGTLGIEQLVNPANGHTWDLTPGADTSITMEGEVIALANSGPLTFLGADAIETANGVTLAFNFEHRVRRVRISRFYAVYPRSPTIETWTRVEAPLTGGVAVRLTNLAGWELTMPIATVRWLGGLRGDSADTEETGAFALASRYLEEDERIEIGGNGRSTEAFVPFVLVDGGEDDFYGGAMWSGAWRMAFERRGDRLTIQVQFPNAAPEASAGRPVEFPHTFFGLTSHSSNDASGALRRFIIDGIRRGRPFQPLVTYNTWFAYGVTISEDAISEEMRAAAALGVELFVVDAGWYIGAGATGDFDFDSGLGTWTADPSRFPNGLAALADEAHGAGMKFGIWVEPERVSLETVDHPGLARETWLATHDGDYGSPNSAQICLARPEARQWLFDRLTNLIDTAHPDYLKWDNNFWTNCNRDGHGHNRDDGNFAHVRALYDMLDELRRRYPDLLIENVSGGGNRMDFGMLAYTDAAWMDDRTSPSAHVRHNLEGLTFAFPPAYLLSFVIDSEGEPIRGGTDFPLIVRSRAAGVLGLTYRAPDLDEELARGLSREIQLYKSYRDTVANANATLLSAQAPIEQPGDWDVLQEVSDDRLSAVIFAFMTGPGEGRLLVRPTGLIGGAVYAVRSLDAGDLGTASGDALMQDGIELLHSEGTLAHVLVLTVVNP